MVDNYCLYPKLINKVMFCLPLLCSPKLTSTHLCQWVCVIAEILTRSVRLKSQLKVWCYRLLNLMFYHFRLKQKDLGVLRCLKTKFLQLTTQLNLPDICSLFSDNRLTLYLVNSFHFCMSTFIFPSCLKHTFTQSVPKKDDFPITL